MQEISEVSTRQLLQLFKMMSQKDKGHASRVAIYMQILIGKLDEATDLLAESTPFDLAVLHSYAANYGFYHDIGKVAGGAAPIDHTIAVEGLLRPIMDQAAKADLPCLEGILTAAKYHHERWDGAGFPLGLRQTNIPLLGRLCAAANEYDHTATRMRKQSHSKIMEAIRQMSENELDPRIVAILDRCSTELVILGEPL